jgi:organic radical activating enzyme
MFTWWMMGANSEIKDRRCLPLVEEFYSLQGEGFHTGRAAWFIRLGGCDVGCNWCDARATWNPRLHPPVEVAAIVRRTTADNPSRAVVITGGEPLLWPLDELTAGLHAAGIEVFLETSGSHPFSGKFDWVCLSPKRRQPPLDEAWGRADELKVIIENADDLDWAEECATRVDPGVKLFLQPEWSRSEEVMPLIVDHIKRNPRWRSSLQSHKYMRIP